MRRDRVGSRRQSWMVEMKGDILDTIRKNIPSRTIKNINSPPWISSEIIHAIKKKEPRAMCYVLNSRNSVQE